MAWHGCVPTPENLCAASVQEYLRFAAQQLTQLAMPFGTLGVRTAVYFLSAFLSMFMNNSATVVPRMQRACFVVRRSSLREWEGQLAWSILQRLL